MEYLMRWWKWENIEEDTADCDNVFLKYPYFDKDAILRSGMKEEFLLS